MYIEKETAFLARKNSQNLATELKTACENFKINFHQALVISFSGDCVISFITKPNNDF